MGNKGNSKGIREGIREIMSAKKTALYTINDMMNELEVEVDVNQVKTAMYQMWRKGELLRHITDDEEHGARFALNIVEKNIKPYEKTRFVKRKISNVPLTKEEAEAFFQDIQNACLAFESILNRCIEFESRLVNQIEDNEKTKALMQEMKSRMQNMF